MSLLSRSIPMIAFAVALGAQGASAQEIAQSDDFRWYVGGQVGAFVFRTPNQTRGGIPMAGAHMLIKAKRGGLFLAVEEAFSDEQQTSYLTAGGEQPVIFNDVRRYTFGLMAFPVRGHMQPYFGIGGGIMHVVSPSAPDGFPDPIANELGSSAFGALMGGIQFRVSGVSAFGQYQIQTVPAYKTFGGAQGRLISSAVHTFTGGVRISLGSSRENW